MREANEETMAAVAEWHAPVLTQFAAEGAADDVAPVSDGSTPS